MFRRYFITGLLIWVPIGITLWVLDTIISTMDLSLSLLPANWQPVAVVGRNLPGLGVVLTVLVVCWSSCRLRPPPTWIPSI